MSGALGHRFGSHLSIDAFRMRFRVKHANDVSASRPDVHRVQQYAQQLLERLGGWRCARFFTGSNSELSRSSSGACMVLTIGRVIGLLFSKTLGAREFASQLKRGVWSGIGIGAFEEGIFLLGSSTGQDASVFPVTARLNILNNGTLCWWWMRMGRGARQAGSRGFLSFASIPTRNCGTSVSPHIDANSAWVV